MYILVCYIGHLAISLIATANAVRNGRVFLIDAFHGNVELADSVNHLLVIGFYLINVATLFGPCAPASKSRRRAAR